MLRRCLMCLCVCSCLAALCPEHERAFSETECQCQAGYSRHEDACTPCPIATFKEYAGDSADAGTACSLFAGCCRCGTNTATIASGSVHSSACVCLPGYGGPSCLPCAAGSYKSVTSTEACAECPPGATTLQLRSSALTDCVAARGHYGDTASGFRQCPAGTYSAAEGVLECTPCPLGAISAPGAVSKEECQCVLQGFESSPGGCTCAPGYTRSADNTCVLCASGFYCVGGELPPAACPLLSTSPLGAAHEAQCLCDPGHTGPPGGPCAACAAGSWKNTSGSAECTQCGTHAHSPPGSTGPCECVPGHVVVGGRCTRCPPGQATFDGQCQDCPINTVSSPDGTECVCGPGLGNASGACDPCPPGTYKAAPGNTDCTERCPPFSSSPPGSAAVADCACVPGYAGEPCRACPLGEYKSTSGAHECQRCPPNTTTATEGSSACVCALGFWRECPECACNECPEHHFADSPGSCARCPPNTHAPSGTTFCRCNPGFELAQGICTACPLGTFSSGQECVNCTALSSTATTGSTSAEHCLCLQGSHRLDGLCTLCAADTFQPVLGGSCIPCPDNTTAPAGASACVCRAGFTRESDTCVQCPAGKYKDSLGDAPCLPCPPNASSPAAATACVCARGFVQASTCTICPGNTFQEGSACVPCPANTVSLPGAFSNLQCTCHPGFTGAAGGPCSKCPHASYSAGGDCVQCPSLTNTTAEGSRHAADCVCVPGHTLTDGACQPCPQHTYKEALGNDMCTPCSAHAEAPAASTSAHACTCVQDFIAAGDGTCDRVCAPGFQHEGAACVGCPPSTYKASRSSAACTHCPAHSFTLLPNRTAVTDCMCEMGHVWNPSTLVCDSCAAGKFNSEANSSECFQCDTVC